jgi:hypothetical protein
MVALDKRVERFVKADSHTIYSDYDPKTAEQILRIRPIRHPPLERWGLLLGDIVHNLRSALDHIVWDLTIRHRGQMPPYPLETDWRGIEFPIFLEKPYFLYGNKRSPSNHAEPRGSGLYKIRGVDPGLRTCFQRLQPFRDRQRRYRHPLMVLHELDLIDKHRTIPVVASVVIPLEVTETEGPIGIPWIRNSIGLELVEIYPRGPFKEGTPLARIRQPQPGGCPGRRGFSWRRSRCDGYIAATIAASLVVVCAVPV